MDPETIFAQLDAGDPAQIVQLGEDLGDSSRSVDRDARAIVMAASKPAWDSNARASFEARGLQLYLSAAMTSLRLVRAGEVLTAVGDFYRETQGHATNLIEQWRARPRDLPLFLDTVQRLQFVAALTRLKTDYEDLLTTAISDYLDTTEEFREWVRRGAILDYAFYLDHDVLPVVRIPDSFINGDGGGWKQQGLGYDEDSNSLLMTSYRDDEGDAGGEASQLTMVDATTGEPGAVSDLRNEDGTSSPDHAGGTVVDGDRVYVVGGGQLHVYDLAALQGGGEVKALHSVDVGASSYVTVGDDGQVYLGDTNVSDPPEPGTLHPVSVSRDGEVSDAGTPIQTPPNTNGALVRDGQIVYSTQSGRHERGVLVTTDHDGDDDVTSFDEDDVISEEEIVNMSQNLTVLPDGRVVGTTESGAEEFSEPTGSGSPSTQWGATHVFEVPNGGAGYEVETETLRESDRELKAAQSGLLDELPRIESFVLPQRWLGEVATAGAFATRVDDYLRTTAERLRFCADGAGVTAEGLALVADSYDESDIVSRLRFTTGMSSML